MKFLWKKLDVTLIFILFSLLYIGYCALSDLKSALIPALLFTALLIIRIIYNFGHKHKLQVKANDFSALLDVKNGNAFERLQISCCVIEDDGEIIWFNQCFADDFGIDKKTPSMSIQSLLKNEHLDNMKAGTGYKFKYDKKHYSVNSSKIENEDNTCWLLYFFNETELHDTRKAYRETRPVMLLTLIDNGSDIYEKFKESECAAIFSKIEQAVDEWAGKFGAVCRKYSNTRMFIVAEEKSLQKMISDKFSILDDIRDFKYDGINTDITLSIGVGYGGSLSDIREYARQALDMAQSRGGDQVAIKDEEKFRFFGGVSEGKEQKNKVKTRFMAKTIGEIIKGSSNLLIMGHRFSDFDAFGSGAGVYALARHLGVQANIVVDKDTTLALPMIDQFVSKEGLDTVVSPERALNLINENTLIVVTDTHKKDFTECPELLDKCGKVMVIDHHRKSVGYIENTVLFYHRPNSSSASEMVAEILQYTGTKKFVDPITAQALFAGIMLDTRNFVIRCGVRTFESAAFLKSCSANTVAAKKLFSSDMDLFRCRNAVIDKAEKYHNSFAYSVADFESKNIRLITSQAADEMLNIENIKASFVLYRNGNDTNISARSFGEVNVQLIMEALGGGGHQAMSACQLKDTDFEQAKEMLFKAIDDYIENQN